MEAIGENQTTIPNARMLKLLRLPRMQSYFASATLKRTYLLVKANDPKAFPDLPS